MIIHDREFCSLSETLKKKLFYLLFLVFRNDGKKLIIRDNIRWKPTGHEKKLSASKTSPKTMALHFNIEEIIDISYFNEAFYSP